MNFPAQSQNYDICTKLLFLTDEEDALAKYKGEHGARVVPTARDILGRKVIDHPSGGVILLRKCKY